MAADIATARLAILAESAMSGAAEGTRVGLLLLFAGIR
jgi:hypothetical protein